MKDFTFHSLAKTGMIQPHLAAIILIVAACSTHMGWTAPVNSHGVVVDERAQEPSIMHESTDEGSMSVDNDHSSRDDRISVPLLNEIPNPTDLDRRVAMLLDPFARIPHSVPGTMIAQYRLPIENSDDYSVVLVMYNPQSRASCKVHGFDGAVHLIDPEGRVYRGNIGGDDLALELTGLDQWPFSNRLVVPFMPSAAVEDLYIYRREAILDVHERSVDAEIRVGERTQQVQKSIPGVAVTWRLDSPVSARTTEGEQQSHTAAVRYELDAGGRLVSYHRVGEEPREIRYRGDTPQYFPLPDPAHGGNWRLHRWQFVEGDNHEALFTPESIRAIIKAWDMR